ncbi:CSS-motif domain-containing protein [Klebsiella pneumoniae]
MVSRKLERLISPGKWIHISISPLFIDSFSWYIFFVLSESVSYLIFRDKIKDYTSDVLVRSESLLVQTESSRPAAKSHLNIGDSPCTNENILHLRVVVWPYPLIKDVGYIIKRRISL